MQKIVKDMQKITVLVFQRSSRGGGEVLRSIFKNSKMGRIGRFGDAGPGPKGSVMSVTFRLEDQEFMALNPQYKGVSRY